jgi:O-antigen/teichoic acid export membrane protein
LAIFAEPLLTLFGQDFSIGLTTLRILLIGQVIMGGAGGQMFVMTMTGHERAAAAVLVACAVGNALLGTILINAFGIVGAAVANTAMLIVWNVAMAVYIWRKLRLAPGLFGLMRFRPLVRKFSAAKACSSQSLPDAISLAVDPMIERQKEPANSGYPDTPLQAVAGR